MLRRAGIDWAIQVAEGTKTIKSVLALARSLSPPRETSHQEGEGIQARTTPNGAVALDEPIDLMLSDMLMPIMDG